MNITKLKSLFFFLILLPIHNCYAIEDPWTRDRIFEESRNSYLNMNFNRLEELSNKFRTDKSKVSTGTWKLTIFYAGVWEGVKNKKDLFKESTWLKNEEITSEWIKQYPNSPAAHITYGSILSYHGWAFRGDDYAANVPEGAWTPFYKYQELAYQYLIKYKNISSIDPTWYDRILFIEKSQGLKKDEMYKIFLEGTNREPYFYESYFHFADILLPKWYGSLKELEEFADLAVTKTKSIDGNIAYARIYMHVGESYPNIFVNTNASWPKLKVGFDEMIEKYPDNWNLNLYAKFACQAGDYKAMTPLMKRIESNPDIDAWNRSTGFYTQCKALSLN